MAVYCELVNEIIPNILFDKIKVDEDSLTFCGEANGYPVELNDKCILTIWIHGMETSISLKGICFNKVRKLLEEKVQKEFKRRLNLFKESYE